MSTFSLNSAAKLPSQVQQPERVRIGSVSLFALVVIIGLAVLAVLAFSTANASLTMSQRQATATSELYLAETAAQEFVAGVDGVLAGARAGEEGEAGAADAAGAAGRSGRAAAGSVSIARDERGNAVYDENGFQVVWSRKKATPVLARRGCSRFRRRFPTFVLRRKALWAVGCR